MKTENEYREIARDAYKNLKKSGMNAIDWRFANQYGIAVSEIAHVIAASNGYLKDRNGVIEVAK